MVRLFLQDPSDHRFDPSQGNLKLLRYAVRHPQMLEFLLQDPRCRRVNLMELAPHFPKLNWGPEILPILVSYVRQYPLYLSNQPHRKQEALLIFGASEGDLDLVHTQLNNDHLYGFPSTVLHQALLVASTNGHLAIVKVLSTKVEPTVQDLQAACCQNHVEVVKFILQDTRIPHKEVSILDKSLYSIQVCRVLFLFESKIWANQFDRIIKKIPSLNSTIPKTFSNPYI